MIPGPNGPVDVPNYALVQGVFIGVVAAYVIVLALFGPENHGSHFERGKTAFQVGASKEDVNSIPPGIEDVRRIERSSMESDGGEEKEGVQYLENERPTEGSHA